MKSLKMLGLAAVAALALTAFVAPSASATTLEIGGTTTTNDKATITATENTSITLSRTDGSFANTCRKSHIHAHTTLFTGPAVTGPITAFSLSECDRPTTVHALGQFEITHIAGSPTNGTLFLENTRVTTGSPFGTLNCETGPTTHAGTITGTAGGHATVDVHAVLSCGFLVPSARLTGAYWITTPTHLAVSP